MEFFQVMHKELIRNFSNIKRFPYGVLLIPKGETVPVSEAIPFHINFLKNVKTAGVAVLLSESTIVNTATALCQLIYGQANIEHQCFMQRDEALTWLDAQIEKHSKTS